MTPNDSIAHTLKKHPVFVYLVAHCVYLVLGEYFTSSTFYSNVRLLKLEEAARQDLGKHVFTEPT